MRWGLVGGMVLLSACTSASEPRDPASAINESAVLRIIDDKHEVLDERTSPDCQRSTRRVVAVDGPHDVDLDELERVGNEDGWTTWWRGEIGPNDHVIHGAPQLAFERYFDGEAAHIWLTIGQNPEYEDAWTLILVGSC